ncbi:MAG: hypothetical protein HZC42_08390 [Candidatus Eisenbacteria bacterium]|nr:hypothetical protein [Candidatus Eisenbacteria bacterium]
MDPTNGRTLLTAGVDVGSSAIKVALMRHPDGAPAEVLALASERSTTSPRPATATRCRSGPATSTA